MNQVPDKPGLYWAKYMNALHLVKIEGQSPFLRAWAVNVENFKYTPFNVRSGTECEYRWLGPANVPGQEEGA